MTHREAQQLALHLMEKHNLLADGWRFRWNNGKRQLGVCRIRRKLVGGLEGYREIKTIGLSRHLVALNPDDEVRDTILHEIAHAIAGVHNGHNHIWKDVCRRIGARPHRLAGEQVKIAEAPYVIVCGSCSRQIARRHRRPSVCRLSNSYCRTCGPASMGKLQVQAGTRCRDRDLC